MSMEEKEYPLLEYLSDAENPVQVDKIPKNIQQKFSDGLGAGSLIHTLFQLQQQGFVREPAADYWQITQSGKEALFVYRQTQFPALCDRVLQFITKPGNKNKAFTTKEISDILGIDYDTVEAIGDKFDEEKLITLSSTEGHYTFHLMERAYRFVREKSFVKEADKTSNSVSNIHNTGTFIQGNTMNQSPFLNTETNLPTKAPNTPVTNKDQNGYWWLNMLSNNWVITIISGLIVGLLVAYIIFRMKWNK